MVLLSVVLAGCEFGFESSITPIAWPTLVPQPFGQTTLGPRPSPLPLAPTPVPPPPMFEGIDSLDCAEPMSGDNHYGYCRIPGTQEFYAWGECTSECPASPYPGIQIMTVFDADSAIFREVIDGRDTSIGSAAKVSLGEGSSGVSASVWVCPASSVPVGQAALGTLGRAAILFSDCWRWMHC